MSSWVSHLPERLADCETIGLGLNAQELKTNPQLSRHVVHDLNQEPRLPFEDDTFDAVICTASIEYLIQPLEVMAEVVRVTRPGGLFVTTFSDRWFPGKEILPWSEMHPFERLGLVMNYYVKTGAFDDLHTLSIRGLPRPLDDKYISETAISDPIFGVWGRVGG
jgi:SAM-dependent methyltransferase